MACLKHMLCINCISRAIKINKLDTLHYIFDYFGRRQGLRTVYMLKIYVLIFFQEMIVSDGNYHI